MTTQPASLPRSISLQDIDMFSAPPVQKVSVVIPVYNEQESLPELIRRSLVVRGKLRFAARRPPARRWAKRMKFCWWTMAVAMTPQ